MSSEGPTTAEDARQNGTASHARKPSDDPQVLREEIERTREQLGQTVEALAAKADVKAQARQKLTQLTTRLKTTRLKTTRLKTTRLNTTRPLAAAAGAIGAAVLALLLILKRRRR